MRHAQISYFLFKIDSSWPIDGASDNQENLLLNGIKFTFKREMYIFLILHS